MTTIAFVPSSTASPPFQANVTLDGTPYALSAAWNVSAQRYYISITDLSGTLIVTTPLIGSPLSSDIYLFYNIFTSSTFLYRADTGYFEINP